MCLSGKEHEKGAREGRSRAPARGVQLVWGARMCRRRGTGLSLGPSVGLGAPVTEDRMSAPRLSEEPCFQPAEQGAL